MAIPPAPSRSALRPVRLSRIALVASSEDMSNPPVGFDAKGQKGRRVRPDESATVCGNHQAARSIFVAVDNTGADGRAYNGAVIIQVGQQVMLATTAEYDATA